MSASPTYLGLLNAIAVGEARGAAVLDAWAEVTPDANVAALLRRIAIREHEHAAAFTKRLSELGFSVNEGPLGDFADKMRLVQSAAHDRDKFEALFDFGASEPAADSLADVFRDVTIDPETGALLGRFIAEERDSERALQACYASLGQPDVHADALDEIGARLARLTAQIDAIRAQRGR